MSHHTRLLTLHDTKAPEQASLFCTVILQAIKQLYSMVQDL
jgi:hypothetical protein